MPTYEYRCENGHTFESFQSMHDDALDACEVCGAKAERVLSAPAVHFKGSGFYTTDYARKGAKKSGSDDGSKDKGPKSSESGDSKGSGDSGSGSSDSGGSKSEKAGTGSSSSPSSSGSGSD